MNGKTYLLLSPGFIYIILAISIFGCIPIFLNSLFLGHENCKADWNGVLSIRLMLANISEF